VIEGVTDEEVLWGIDGLEEACIGIKATREQNRVFVAIELRN
jgi:hypothetical protein